jgi:hypothetical protein
MPASGTFPARYDRVYWAANDRLLAPVDDEVVVFTPGGDRVDVIRVPAAAIGSWYTVGKS